MALVGVPPNLDDVFSVTEPVPSTNRQHAALRRVGAPIIQPEVGMKQDRVPEQWNEEYLISAAGQAARAVAPGARERDRNGTPDLEAFKCVRESGILTARVPRRYGGPGVSYVGVCEMMTELASVDPSLTQVLQPHFGFLDVVALGATEAQKRRFFGGIVRGDHWGNATIELGVKTALHFETSVHRRDGVGVVNGTKFYCTGTSYSDVIPVLCVEDGARLILAMVPRDAAGVDITDDWDAMGQRATASGTVRFADVAVGLESLVDLSCLNSRNFIGGASQIMQCAIDAGIARGALADAVDYVRHKARPWVDSGVKRAADDPYVQERVGRMRAMVTISDTMVRRGAACVDETYDAQVVRQCGGDELEELLVRASTDIAVAKIASTEAALRVSEMLFELGGASATMSKYGYDRHWRNARTHTTHDPLMYKFKHLGNLELSGTPPPNNFYV